MSDGARHLEAWTATHDNRWRTQAIQNPDGTFSAWALAEGATALDPDYVEMDSDNAKRAAEFALARKTGHRACSSACSGWALHTHAD